MWANNNLPTQPSIPHSKLSEDGGEVRYGRTLDPPPTSPRTMVVAPNLTSPPLGWGEVGEAAAGHVCKHTT